MTLHQPFLPVNPKQINGKWYIPLRAFIQYLGGIVDWNDNGTIGIKYGNNKTYIVVNSTKAKLNEKDIRFLTQL
ncbi:MAG TPA: hypothetical protein GXX15_06425 [Clostridia bacterium]|nr:hypothetical protein [Clostridia bacterium]